MTEKKQGSVDDEAAGKSVKKVSTGAWWKSAFNLLPKKKSESPRATEVSPAGDEVKGSTTETLKDAEQNEAVEQKTVDSATGEEETKPKRSRARSKAKPARQKKPAAQQESIQKDKKEKTAQQHPKRKEKVVTKLLINAEEPEECRIALVENGRLESFHVTSVVRERTKNNIYKGRIVSIEPNLQAAFIEISGGRNGFLPFNEIHPEYYRHDVNEKSRELIAQHQWKKLKIENVVSKGQEVLVQVVKEATGNKGANMTTYLSLPGRYLVLMPGSDSSGISRKISGEESRHQLREMMSGFSIPEGIGYIIRTASVEITKTALQKDLRYLLRLWSEIKKKGQTHDVPALIYKDQDIVVRFLRDHFVSDIQEILVDTQESYDQVQKFAELLPTKQRKVKIKLHRGAKPVFNFHNIEAQIESIYKPQVQLPSGGSIVINPTEALVAIDVNSGRTSKDSNFDETIFLANKEAAAELARQLRLRDLGGLIVVDFIDMRNKKHIREVEKLVKASMKRDKAKVDISTISRFGLMQISRQKMGAPIEKGIYHICDHCKGRGVVRSVEAKALFYLRRIQTGISRQNVNRVECSLPVEVAQYLLNKKRAELTELEAQHKAVIDIIMKPEMKPGENKIDFLEQE